MAYIVSGGSNSFSVRHAQAALLLQVEEKRAKKERELAAKQEEDEVERIRVIRALAEERAANRCRWALVRQ